MAIHTQRNPDGQLVSLMEEPLWLPTRLLAKEMNSKKAWRSGPFGFRVRFRPSRHFCMKAQVFPDTWPTETHPSISFVREVAGGVAPLDTALYKRVAAGEVISRYIGVTGERAKIKIRNQHEFLQYAERVSNLLALASSQGIQPISSRADVDPSIAIGKEGDIGIAMIDNEVHFYRKGHHRLGAALALGIDRVPCQCYFLSNNDGRIADLSDLKNRTVSALKAQE